MTPDVFFRRSASGWRIGLTVERFEVVELKLPSLRRT